MRSQIDAQNIQIKLTYNFACYSVSWEGWNFDVLILIVVQGVTQWLIKRESYKLGQDVFNVDFHIQIFCQLTQFQHIFQLNLAME